LQTVLAVDDLGHFLPGRTTPLDMEVYSAVDTFPRGPESESIAEAPKTAGGFVDWRLRNVVAASSL